MPVSVDSVNLSTQDDSSIAQCISTHCISNAELSAEERYRHALQFYKGSHLNLPGLFSFFCATPQSNQVSYVDRRRLR